MRQRSEAWQQGYEDAKNGRSDFARRAFSGFDRLDYMDGRLAYIHETGWTRGEHQAEARAAEAHQEAKHGDA